MQFRAVVPVGVKAGQIVRVNAGGAFVNVRLPKGLQAGDAFLFDLSEKDYEAALSSQTDKTGGGGSAGNNDNNNSNKKSSATSSGAQQASPSKSGGKRSSTSSLLATLGGSGGAGDPHKERTDKKEQKTGGQTTLVTATADNRNSVGGKKNKNSNKNSANKAPPPKLRAGHRWLIRDRCQCSDFGMALTLGLAIGLSIVFGFILGILSVTEPLPGRSGHGKGAVGAAHAVPLTESSSVNTRDKPFKLGTAKVVVRQQQHDQRRVTVTAQISGKM